MKVLGWRLEEVFCTTSLWSSDTTSILPPIQIRPHTFVYRNDKLRMNWLIVEIVRDLSAKSVLQVPMASPQPFRLPHCLSFSIDSGRRDNECEMIEQPWKLICPSKVINQQWVSEGTKKQSSKLESAQNQRSPYLSVMFFCSFQPQCLS
jgi:hypothetical protein